MKINYTARNTTITPEIKKYCERRLNSIKKFLGYETEADLLLAQEKYHKTVRYGAARGREPVNYVDNIRNYYDLLVWYTTTSDRSTRDRLLSAEND